MTRPTVRTLLGQSAARTPDATALRDPERDETVRYAALDRRASAVAAGLADAGFEPGDRLTVAVRDSVEFVELLFGAAGAGVVFNPLSPRIAPDRLSYVLGHAEPAGLVVDGATRETAASVAADLPDRAYGIGDADPDPDPASDPDGAAGPADAPYDALVGDPDDAPDRAVGEDDPALLLYTSGTTGRPKGVRHSHRTVVTAGLVGLPYNRLRPTDVSVAFGPLYHVGPLCCNFVPALQVGATNLILREFDADRALSHAREEGITAIWAVPTHLNALVSADDPDDSPLADVRTIQYSGAAMPAAVAEAIRDRAPDCDLVNAYGTTEIVYGTVLFPEAHDDRLGSIGRAVPTVEVRLADPADPDPSDPVPAGETGEILVDTPMLMDGYWRAPEETADALVDGWYRTGDLGRRDADGSLRFVDRTDNMIVTGGENVYPAEVEDVLHDHPGVAAAAVVGIPDDQWGEVVGAVVVPEDDPDGSGDSDLPDDLEAFCLASDALEDHKRPRRYAVRGTLPRTSSGKIDRAALVSLFDAGGG